MGTDWGWHSGGAAVSPGLAPWTGLLATCVCLSFVVETLQAGSKAGWLQQPMLDLFSIRPGCLSLSLCPILQESLDGRKEVSGLKELALTVPFLLLFVLEFGVTDFVRAQKEGVPLTTHCFQAMAQAACECSQDTLCIVQTAAVAMGFSQTDSQLPPWTHTLLPLCPLGGQGQAPRKDRVLLAI